MSKAPTVNELMGKSNVTFKPAIVSFIDEKSRSDIDGDVLWKQTRTNQKQRTMSIGSSDFEGSGISTPRVDVPRPRRLSVSEMLFGSFNGVKDWMQSSLQNSPLDERKISILEDEPFKDVMKGQNKFFGDDGVCSFEKRDDMK
ncbi:hypothetical protein DICVIV_08894 [Dictyocaulus viviparus]|uniref:Uncharacterized protein n=1 Tax=Dictyocaulus viviparus TaxID=29172 RepID=A0A0D8XMU7_DICVI|nr:hypothetical protein DICVIV_08894 [Dictyocaulus viviparus]